MSTKTEIRKGGLDAGVMVTVSDMCPDVLGHFFKPGMEVDLSRDAYDILCDVHKSRPQTTWKETVERMLSNIHMALTKARDDGAALSGIGLAYELPNSQMLVLMCKTATVDGTMVVLVLTPMEYEKYEVAQELMRPFRQMAASEVN